MSDDTDDSKKTIILLFEVPPPRSGHVVDLLQEVGGINTAYAVYSLTDVVAIFHGTEAEYREARKVIAEWHAPIEDIDEFYVDYELTGMRHDTRVQYLRNACRAFVLCDVGDSVYAVDFAATVLKGFHEVVRLYTSHERHQVLLDIATEDIANLDAAVMENMQKRLSVVQSTRTLITINSLGWEREQGIERKPRIFVGLAKEDLPIATVIETQIGRDTGLDIWDYRQIPDANPSWPATIDDAMDKALLHIFVMGPTFVHSLNCVKEYGRSLGVGRSPLDTLCILVPGYTVSALPHTMQERQMVSCSDILWYSKVLSWIYDRLKAQRHLELVE